MEGEIRPASIFNASLAHCVRCFVICALTRVPRHSNLSSRDRTLPFIIAWREFSRLFVSWTHCMTDGARARARAFYVDTAEILAEMRAICGRVVFNNSLISLAVVRARNFPISVLAQTSLIKRGEMLGD